MRSSKESERVKRVTEQRTETTKHKVRPRVEEGGHTRRSIHKNGVRSHVRIHSVRLNRKRFHIRMVESKTFWNSNYVRKHGSDFSLCHDVVNQQRNGVRCSSE